MVSRQGLAALSLSMMAASVSFQRPVAAADSSVFDRLRVGSDVPTPKPLRKCNGLPDFRPLSDIDASGHVSRALHAAGRWLAAQGRDPSKFFYAIGSEAHNEEVYVVDEAEC